MEATRRTCLVPSCNAGASDLIDIALCSSHAISIHSQTSALLDRVGQTVRDKAGIKRRTERARPLQGQRAGHVYFMRFGKRIKIGWTANIEQRTRQLQPDEVLALMPGTMQDERAMHARFGPSWVHGEYFDMSPEMAALIAELQSAA